MNRTEVGNENKLARAKAVEKLKSMRGKKLTPVDLFDLVIAIGQYLGFIDKDEKVK